MGENLHNKNSGKKGNDIKSFQIYRSPRRQALKPNIVAEMNVFESRRVAYNVMQTLNFKC